MTKVDPSTARIQIFIIAVDPYHRYSNESERADKGIYDDFKLKKILWLRCFLQINSAL